MWRQSTPLWVAARVSPGAKGLAVAVLVGAILGSAPATAEAAWGMFYMRPSRVVRAARVDQSWLMDIPQRPGARSKGKVAVFVFKGDDVYQPVRAEVVRVLRLKGLNVTTTLRPVDSAAQYREMSYALNLAAYVEGDLTGEGARGSAQIRLRSGVTGQVISAAKFSGPTQKIVGGIGRRFWPQVGAAMLRACSSASRPRRREREPLRIEAGTPLEKAPIASQGG
jgi:hypothetical protein